MTKIESDTDNPYASPPEERERRFKILRIPLAIGRAMDAYHADVKRNQESLLGHLVTWIVVIGVPALFATVAGAVVVYFLFDREPSHHLRLLAFVSFGIYVVGLFIAITTVSLWSRKH